MLNKSIICENCMCSEDSQDSSLHVLENFSLSPSLCSLILMMSVYYWEGSPMQTKLAFMASLSLGL